MVRPSLEALTKATARPGDRIVDPAAWPDVLDAMSRADRRGGRNPHAERRADRRYTKHRRPASQTKLAGLIGAGETVERAAERRGVSVHTARAQLKAVFGKTDAHRQAELVALMAKLRGFP
jgi:DNA-binding CsgD family transcriptional regulator